METSLSTIYEDHASLLHFLSQTSLPKPPALTLAAGFSINAGLRRALERTPIDAVQVRALLGLARADQIVLDSHLLGYIADQRMKRAMVELNLGPESPETLDDALTMAKTLRLLPFELNLWHAQNIWYDTLRLYRKRPMGLHDEDAVPWMEKFYELGRCLSIAVDELVVEEESTLTAEATPAASV